MSLEVKTESKISKQAFAQVVELVDTLSSGGSGVSRAGSSPALGTTHTKMRLKRLNFVRFFGAFIQN